MRKPDLTILTRDGAPYLERWWLIPRNKYFNVYLHKISSSDDDRCLHCHPWYNCSIILKGYYHEMTLTDQSKRFYYDSIKFSSADSSYGLPTVTKRRNWLSVTFRKPRTPHRLIIDPSKPPVWTLFITGPVIC